VIIMADSTVTKNALANALRRQMEEEPFSKITIGEICDRCNMNRKSFYYHFKDKFDLVEWLFGSEIKNAINGKEYADKWEYIEDICGVIHSSRKFYREIFRIKGQNSLLEKMSDLFCPIIENELTDTDNLDFCAEFLTDSLIYSIEKWACGKDVETPGEFVSKLKKSLLKAAEIV